VCNAESIKLTINRLVSAILSFWSVNNELKMKQSDALEDSVKVLINGTQKNYRWQSENGSHVPMKIQVIDDTCSADKAFKLAFSGVGLIWVGDFQNARQLLQALSRRMQRRVDASMSKHQALGVLLVKRSVKNVNLELQGSHALFSDRNKVLKDTDINTLESDISDQDNAEALSAFEVHRLHQKERAEVLGRLLIPVQANHSVDLKRAPDIKPACHQAYGEQTEDYLVSLRELQGVIGAYEWRKKGLRIDLSEIGIQPFTIHPHYAVFSPNRLEYLKLLAQAPLPPSIKSESSALDIGTGTGILSIILAKRGIKKIIATDSSLRAVACAQINVQSHHLQEIINVQQVDLFPADQRASLVVCNPPWLPNFEHPAKPITRNDLSIAPDGVQKEISPKDSLAQRPLDAAVFDTEGRMLRSFLLGLASHLMPSGEGWLIMSDLAELLGLRSKRQIPDWIEQGGLKVIQKIDIRPQHKKSKDKEDPFYAARSKELTSLWRLQSIKQPQEL